MFTALGVLIVVLALLAFFLKSIFKENKITYSGGIGSCCLKYSLCLWIEFIRGRRKNSWECT